MIPLLLHFSYFPTGHKVHNLSLYKKTAIVMDPLSLTASIIAVLGVGGQAAKGIGKLASIKGTPELVLALNNEISDLQVVVLAIQDLFDKQTTSGVPFPGHRAEEKNIDTSIINSLKQANSTVTNLEAFYKRLKVSNPGSTGAFTFDKTLWIREQRRIKRIKEDIRNVRIKLTTALGALNAYVESSTPKRYHS